MGPLNAEQSSSAVRGCPFFECAVAAAPVISSGLDSSCGADSSNAFWIGSAGFSAAVASGSGRGSRCSRRLHALSASTVQGSSVIMGKECEWLTICSPSDAPEKLAFARKEGAAARSAPNKSRQGAKLGEPLLYRLTAPSGISRDDAETESWHRFSETSIGGVKKGCLTQDVPSKPAGPILPNP